MRPGMLFTVHPTSGLVDFAPYRASVRVKMRGSLPKVLRRTALRAAAEHQNVGRTEQVAS